MLSQLNAYYDAYEEELMELYQNASPLAGFMGMGGHPRDDRCNDIFYRNIEKWVAEFLNTNPSREDAEAVAEWILKLAQVHRNDKTFWFCFAIQAHSKKLIPLMSREKALELQKWYDEAYPKLERLPAQNEVYKVLQKHSGHFGFKGQNLFRKK